jgi:hypothetical protein
VKIKYKHFEFSISVINVKVRNKRWILHGRSALLKTKLSRLKKLNIFRAVGDGSKFLVSEH